MRPVGSGVKRREHARRERGELLQRHWVRFDRYVLTGDTIRPAPRAVLRTYDPWDEYRQARQGRKDQEPPYASLIGLLDSMRLKPDGGPQRPSPYLHPRLHGEAAGTEWTLTPDSLEQLLTWCSQHGLLGILPHRARLIALAPRWDRTKQGAQGDKLVAQQEVFTRTSTGWRCFALPDPTRRVPRGAKHGGLVPPQQYRPGWVTPFVEMEDLLVPGWKRGSLQEELARFFPGVPRREADTYRYPRPLTEEFWRAYAEPLDDFLYGASALESALRWAHTEKDPTSLNPLVAPVHTVLERDGEGFRLRWVPPSLLATFAMMAVQDLAEHRDIRQCAACGRLFVSGAYQTQYCSPRCRYRAQKRRQRASVRKRG